MNGYGYGNYGMQGGMQGYGGGYGGQMGGGYGGNQAYGGPMADGYGNGNAGYGARGGAGRGGGGFGRQPDAGGPRSGPGQRGAEFTEGKLFLGGLDNATTKESLYEYCTQWGEVSDYVMMEGRGFGFVTYKDPTSAQRFLEQKDHYIDGKKIEAKAAVPKNSGNSPTLTRKMFVGGTGEIGDEEFKEYFMQYGEIEDSVVLRKPDGMSRGFGFITFKDEMSVEKCLVKQHTLNGKQVEIKRAVKKEEMGGGTGGSYGGGAGGGYGEGAGGYGGGGGGAGGPVRQGREADWICPDGNCHNKNFGWRTHCNRCQIPKPALLKGVGMSPGAGPVVGGNGYSRGGSVEYEGPSGYASGGGQGMPEGGASQYMGGGMGMGGYGMGMGGMGYNGMGGMGGGYGNMGGMGMGGGMGGQMGGMGGQMGGMGGQMGQMGGGRRRLRALCRRPGRIWGRLRPLPPLLSKQVVG
ncbi:g12460 [Coccomyxa viridis]|uniref:G12460 protein n=1 Tax=Coccomyxa viridis TaxID=1274662 RepID=A0ABP1GAR5_9CHLO